MSAVSAVKVVRFNLDSADVDDLTIPDFANQWEFIKYSLLMREDFSLTALVDSLVQRGIISADAGTEITGQNSKDRAKLERCVTEVTKAGPDGYFNFCEILRELGYGTLVDAVNGEHSTLTSQRSDLSFSDVSGPICTPVVRHKESLQWTQAGPGPGSTDILAVTGKKMSLSALAKDTKASQREFAIIIERQAELEKHLSQVMKSLDSAKDLLIKERQEKLALRDKTKTKEEEVMEMQRKYLELQKAMGMLRETNNKYHEKITKLQIENEQLRKGVKDKTNVELELSEKNKELIRLKETLKRQEKQITNQEENIIQKLSMIEKVVTEHKSIIDGQDELQHKVEEQAFELTRLSEEKAESQNQLFAQQRQLNFQQAQLGMLQEQMQRLEGHMSGNAINLSPANTFPETQTNGNQTQNGAGDNRGKRYISSLARSMNVRPFNTSGKLEASKNAHWRDDIQNKKTHK